MCCDTQIVRLFRGVSLLSEVEQNKTFGLVLRVVAIIAGIAVLLLTMYLKEELGWKINHLAALFAPFVVGSIFWTWGSRHLAPLADEVLASDPRKPILYLRSFASESQVSEAEQSLAEMFESVGPFVAIGAPGERLPPLGAARLYLEDDNWQAKVRELLNRAGLVLIFGGSTKGLGWEFDQVVKTIHPSRVAIMVPNNAETYEKFRTIASNAANVFLPPFPSGDMLKYATFGLAGFISFDDNWGPYFKSLPKASNRGRGLSFHGSGESGRAWAALSEIYQEQGLKVADPPRNWTMIFLSGVKIYLLLVAIPFVIFLLLWAIGIVGVDNQTGPYWVR